MYANRKRYDSFNLFEQELVGSSLEYRIRREFHGIRQNSAQDWNSLNCRYNSSLIQINTQYHIQQCQIVNISQTARGKRSMPRIHIRGATCTNTWPYSTKRSARCAPSVPGRNQRHTIGYNVTSRKNLWESICHAEFGIPVVW